MDAAPAGSGRSRPLVCVDLADVETRPREVAAALLSAAENEGFFYLVNHGVPQHEVDAAFALSRSFFTAPDDVKRATRGDTVNAHYVLGYTTEELEEGTMRQGMLCGAWAAASTPSQRAAPDSRLAAPRCAAYDNSRMASLWPSDEQLPGFKQARCRRSQPRACTGDVTCAPAECVLRHAALPPLHAPAGRRGGQAHALLCACS